MRAGSELTLLLYKHQKSIQSHLEIFKNSPSLLHWYVLLEHTIECQLKLSNPSFFLFNSFKTFFHDLVEHKVEASESLSFEVFRITMNDSVSILSNGFVNLLQNYQ